MPGSGARGRAVARLLIAPVAAILLASACTSVPEEDRPTPGPTVTPPSLLRVGVGEIGTLDPAALDSPDSVLVASHLFEGLVRHDPVSGAVEPAAADRWDALAGGRRFVFHLRESTFHDGTPVRAQDFVRSWTRLVNPRELRPFAFLLRRVAGFERHRLTFGAKPFFGVRAIDDRTLGVRLSVAWPDFLSVLAHPALAPVPESVETPAFAVRPIGNGPFILAEGLGLGTAVVLKAFPGAATPPGVAGVEFRPLDTPDAGWPAFLSGDLDVAPIPGPLLDSAVGVYGNEGIRPIGRLLYCGFNLSDRRFREPALRTAVSLALDRSRLAEVVFGSPGVPATGVLPPGFSGYRDGACGDRCERNLERARALVAEVPGRSSTFPIDFSEGGGGEELAEAVRAQLAEIGITVQLRPRTERRFVEVLRRGKHAFFCLTWVADVPRPQAMLEPLFAPGSAENRTGVNDERLAKLLERARAEADAARRERLYARAERRALELMPLVPIAWQRSRYAVQPWVEGFSVDPLGMFDAAEFSIRAATASMP